MVTAAQRRTFSIAEYHRLGETGVLGPEERTELIKGEIVTMTPIGPGHAWSVREGNTVMHDRLSLFAIVQCQCPIQLPNDSEPNPDIAVLRLVPDRYRGRHPQAADVLLLTEVSDSTLLYDRQDKLPLYAAAAIPEVWIVNLKDRQVEVYRDPNPTGYRQQQVFTGTAPFAPLAFPTVYFRPDELLP